MKMPKRRTFIISRTDSIGDVVLTLPVAGVLRSLYPSSRILFLGKTYTEAILRACRHIDDFLNWDEIRKLPATEQVKVFADTGADTIIHVFPNPKIAMIARQAGIPERIGTTRRLYHWYFCNRRVELSRRHSPYHEAQLNLQLLTVLGAKELYSLEEIGGLYGLSPLSALPAQISDLPDPGRFNLILHPKSQGNGREWGLDNFIRLLEILPQDQFKIFITGTTGEGKLLEPLFRYPFVTNLTGKLTLDQLLTFISRVDGLVASGTGPLHLAAAVGVHALGIFPPIRPVHPGRWAPVGKKAHVFVLDKNCGNCRKTKDCACIRAIMPIEVKAYLQSLLKDRVSYHPA